MNKLPALTADVVKCLALGYSRRRTAEALKITESNVKERTKRAIKFTGARDRVHLAYLYHHELFRIGLEALCSD